MSLLKILSLLQSLPYVLLKLPNSPLTPGILADSLEKDTFLRLYLLVLAVQTAHEIFLSARLVRRKKIQPTMSVLLPAALYPLYQNQVPFLLLSRLFCAFVCLCKLFNIIFYYRKVKENDSLNYGPQMTMELVFLAAVSYYSFYSIL